MILLLLIFTFSVSSDEEIIASAEAVKSEKVKICGDVFGIKMLSKGAIVVKITGVETATGYKTPAKDAGIEIGDIIKKVNETEILSHDDFVKALNFESGEDLTLLVDRNGEEKELVLSPEKAANDNLYKAGMWVKDSAAGLGILTFFDEKDNIFAGLGHGICESETGVLIPMEESEIVKVDLFSVKKSQSGTAGQLQGYLRNEESVGTAYKNSETGINGILKENAFEGIEIEIADKSEIKKGKAQILTTIDENGPQYFDIEIEKINLKSNKKTKNMQIKITDKTLIEKTGGIVQGMSGSPIVQNGKLVGAVTHVVVSDPCRGYGIFIENML